MNGLEKANDEYLQERMLRLAQLRSGADMFERRLLRSHPICAPGATQAHRRTAPEKGRVVKK